MPYIGNTTSDFSIDTGNITNRAVTALKLSPASVGSNGQVLSVDGSGNLQWASDTTGIPASGGTFTGNLIFQGDTTWDSQTNAGKDLVWDESASELKFNTQTYLKMGNAQELILGFNTYSFLTSTGYKLVLGPTSNHSVELLYGNSAKFETTNLGAKVNGDLQMGGTAGVRFHHTGTTSIFETQTAADSLLIKTTPSGGSTTSRMRITDGGVIETGTAIGDSGFDSNARLRIGRANDCNIAIRVTGDTTSHTGIYFGDDDAANSGYIQYMHNGDYMRFFTNGNNERLRIDSVGKVGIGTTSPAGKLTVHNTDDANVNVFEVYNDNGNMSGSFSQSSTGDGTLGVKKNDGTLSVFFRSNGVSYLNGGNVGIGTTSPGQLLEINGASNPCVLVKDTTNNCISYMYSQDSVATFGSASNHPLVFNVNNGEKARFDTSGRLLINTTTSRSCAAGDHKIQVENTSTEGISLTRTTADSGGINISFIKTRNGSAVQDGDDCGAINWFADDGTDTNSYVARIQGAVDGSPGSNDTPGRLVFSTTDDGGSTTTERLKITSAGRFRIKSPNSNTGLQQGRIEWWNENNAGIMAMLGVDRTAGPKAPADLVFYTSDDVDSAANNGEGDRSEKMRITSGGQVVTYFNAPYLMVGINASQDVANASGHKIDWVEITDRKSNFDTSNERFTAPVGGDYLVCLSIQYTVNVNQLHTGIYKNGTNPATNFDPWVNHGDDTRGDCTSAIINLATNDYIELYTYQNTGSSKSLETNRTKATIRFLG